MIERLPSVLEIIGYGLACFGSGLAVGLFCADSFRPGRYL